MSLADSNPKTGLIRAKKTTRNLRVVFLIIQTFANVQLFQADRQCRLGFRLSETLHLAAVVKRDMVPVGVGEGECAAERPVNWRTDDSFSVGCEGVMDRLRICRVQPNCCTNARLRHSVKVDAWNHVSNGERYGLCVKDDGVLGACLRTRQPEVLLVERCRLLEIAHL